MKLEIVKFPTVLRNRKLRKLMPSMEVIMLYIITFFIVKKKHEQ